MGPNITEIILKYDSGIWGLDLGLVLKIWDLRLGFVLKIWDLCLRFWICFENLGSRIGIRFGNLGLGFSLKIRDWDLGFIYTKSGFWDIADPWTKSIRCLFGGASGDVAHKTFWRGVPTYAHLVAAEVFASPLGAALLLHHAEARAQNELRRRPARFENEIVVISPVHSLPVQ